MDTTKVIFKNDTIVSTKDSLGKSFKKTKSIETITIKDSDSAWDSLCNCPLIGGLIWPFTLLIIILLFYKQIRTLIKDIGVRIKRGDKIKIGPSGLEMSQELDKEDLKSKAEKEYNETVKDQGNIEQEKLNKEDFIPKYIAIERQLFNVLLKVLYPAYRILSNRRMQGYEFDLIIETLGKKDHDYIAEVKYFPKQINKSVLQNISLQLDFLKQVYENTTNKKARPILFLVLGNEMKVDENLDVFEHVNQPFKDKNYIRTVLINQNDIENLNSIRIMDILEYEG